MNMYTKEQYLKVNDLENWCVLSAKLKGLILPEFALVVNKLNLICDSIINVQCNEKLNVIQERYKNRGYDPNKVEELMVKEILKLNKYLFKFTNKKYDNRDASVVLIDLLDFSNTMIDSYELTIVRQCLFEVYGKYVYCKRVKLN